MPRNVARFLWVRMGLTTVRVAVVVVVLVMLKVAGVI